MGVGGTRRKGGDARNDRPKAGANEVMLEYICLGGKAEEAVKHYPIEHPVSGNPRINPSFENVGSGKKGQAFQ